MARRKSGPYDEPKQREPGEHQRQRSPAPRRIPGQAVAEHEHVARSRRRAAVEDGPEQPDEHVRRQRAEAADRTNAVAARVAELSAVLVDGLAAGAPSSAGQLRHTYRPWAFVPDRALITPGEAPQWEEFAPQPNMWTSWLFTSGGRATAQARARFESALSAYRAREEQRLAVLAVAESQHAIAESARRDQIERHNAHLDRVERAVEARSPEAVEEYYKLLIAASRLPNGLSTDVEVAYQPDARKLLVIRELPVVEIVPPVREYHYDRTLDKVGAKYRTPKELRQLYSSLVAQLVLRTMHGAFEVRPGELVNEVAVNGHVSTRNKATGRFEHPCLVSVTATREQFSGLVLTRLDPRECLRHLNAVVSPHPWDLEAVRPIFDPDLSKYRIADSHDAAASLDGRPVLLAMPPVEFEHLVRQLFEAMGMRSWVTQASGDDGVDAVAVNEDPIMGGVCVVQAKRYSGIVAPDAVRALAGVMEDKRAGRGVLVTTSWFGRATHDFAARHGRIQLIDGAQLKHLLAEHLDLHVTVGRLDRAAPRRQPGVPPASD